MQIQELKDKHVAILGLGIEGLALAEYFLDHRIACTVFDEKTKNELQKAGEEWARVLQKLHGNKASLVLGYQWNDETLQQFDIVFRSPGISLDKSFFHNYKGIISSQTKLFFDNCPSKILGVTGTKGKGTTSTLIYEMLKQAGFDAYLGGNIGKPPIAFLDILSPQSIVVLEMSSFQLQDIKKSPHVSVMLMVTSEHLSAWENQNYHKTVEEYIEAKRNIVRFQQADDMAILNIDYDASNKSQYHTKAKVAFVSRYEEVSTGCFVRDNKIILRTNDQETEIIDTSKIILPGAHNFENICAAVMTAHFLGVAVPEIASVLSSFKGLEHRLELVREVGGVRYYDDSFATVPEPTIAAIQAFSTPKILILGGSSKKSDFTKLGEVISASPNIKAIIGIGIEWEKIKEKILNSKKIKIVEGCRTMKEIVTKATKLAQKGDVVLLSPACASFDMFENYKDRGDQFKEQVNML